MWQSTPPSFTLQDEIHMAFSDDMKHFFIMKQDSDSNKISYFEFSAHKLNWGLSLYLQRSMKRSEGTHTRRVLTPGRHQSESGTSCQFNYQSVRSNRSST